MEETHELLRLFGEKIEAGHAMVKRLKVTKKLDGIDKFIRKIQQEIRFLEKVRSTGNIKKEHLQSTNLIHLNAIGERLLSSEKPIAIMKPFKLQKSRLEVDIVCDSGSTWIKVIARNAKALTLISLGNGEYGQKSVLDQAESYLSCARGHPHLYRAPEVVFHFAYGIEEMLAKKLERLGIVVEGTRNNARDDHVLAEKVFPFESENESSDSSDESKRNGASASDLIINRVNVQEIKLLNLDVSTLLAYVTNMTNGYAHFLYEEPLLSMQAEWERSRPVKPILDKLFEGKDLVVCQTAFENFRNIIDVIGGPMETARAQEFIKRVRIIEDISKGRVIERLPLGGKIKDRSRLVFATGENVKGITVSANEGFVRAARMQGIECAVFLHEPRSLSEVKESRATKMDLRSF
ncbi:UPF0415 protein C7orf25 [Cephus cinctus]|uniref:UPF0415 protein C7orf25 n=1 Tax=Cephus cinctus TaxID=211228 RepID=A0AAJ7CFH6_CEPCN|nr:UPF0415 protein C7orf25 [Cephus cinctus]